MRIVVINTVIATPIQLTVMNCCLSAFSLSFSVTRYHPRMPITSSLATKQSHTIATWIPALDEFGEYITTGLSLLCKALFNFFFTLFNSCFTFYLPSYRFSSSHLPHFPFQMLISSLCFFFSFPVEPWRDTRDTPPPPPQFVCCSGFWQNFLNSLQAPYWMLTFGQIFSWFGGFLNYLFHF